MDEGCSTLVRRLEQKYLDDDDAFVQDIIFTGFTGCSPCKMASRRALELLVLNHMNIGTIGDSNKLKALASHVVEADLGWNQITEWVDISTILNNLPNLRVLNIGHNPLISMINARLPQVPHLQTIILNGTNLKFPTLKAFLSVMPNLSELHLSDNQFTDDDDTEPISSTVRTIHLNRCQFSNWLSVMRIIRRFPNVCAVYLCENPLEVVQHTPEFEELSSWSFLNVGKTTINSWDSIDELNQMKSITDLRIPNVPLLEGLSDDERLHLLVGRIHQLRVLNGSVITAEQREHSERYFIRYYQERNEKPPQYKVLIDKHGQLEKLVNVDLTPKNSAKVKVVCEETDVDMTININLNKKILEFMKFLDPKTGIKYTRMRVFFCRSDGQVEECISSSYNMPLHYLRVEDDDMFMIQSKIVVPRSRRRPRSSTSSSS